MTADGARPDGGRPAWLAWLATVERSAADLQRWLADPTPGSDPDLLPAAWPPPPPVPGPGPGTAIDPDLLRRATAVLAELERAWSAVEQRQAALAAQLGGLRGPRPRQASRYEFALGGTLDVAG